MRTAGDKDKLRGASRRANAAGRSARAAGVRTAAHAVRDSLATVDGLILGEDLARARGLLEDILARSDNPAAWWKYARVLEIAGEDIAARAVRRTVFLKIKDPNILDVISARVPYVQPHIYPEFRLVYLSVPKCGSSTIKDGFLVGEGKPARGERSHHATRERSELVALDALRLQHAGSDIVAIIRPPLERVRSYWKKNIAESSSLAREVHGRESFYGLSTHPSYLEILSNFHRYRAVFRGFRLHTDALPGFLGYDPGLLNILGTMRDINRVLSLIEERSGREVPKIYNMRSPTEEHPVAPEIAALEEALMAGFYAEEMAYYGRYFDEAAASDRDR